MPGQAEEPQLAISISPRDAENQERPWRWSGWRRRHWPADVIKPGLWIYAFDPSRRCLFAVLEVTHGAAFQYRSWAQFSTSVRAATGWSPDPQDSHRREMPVPTPSRPCTGYVIRWKIGRRVSIPWAGKFPQLGWLRLRPEDRPLLASDIGDPEPGRVATMVSRVLRDTRVSLRLKALHEHICQRCGGRLELHDGRGYSEAHHLQPLGAPHKGPDIPQNVVVLCPNCHALCDLGAIQLSKNALRFRPEHEVEQRYIDYHNGQIFRGKGGAT